MITKIKPFINNYNWQGINFGWKRFETNDITIALNVLYAKNKKKYMLMLQNLSQTVKNKLLF